MTAALATVETDRLAKLIRLVFSSDNDGKIVAAVAAAKRLLAASDLDAHWLADRLAAPPIAVAQDRQYDDGDAQSLIWWCWHHRDRLAPRDLNFIAALTRWRGPLSTKQEKWLRDVCDKLTEAA
jgi:hypothetical protein